MRAVTLISPLTATLPLPPLTIIARDVFRHAPPCHHFMPMPVCHTDIFAATPPLPALRLLLMLAAAARYAD